MEKKELRPNELKPSVIGNEKKLIQSLKTPQVCQRPIEDLKEVLRMIMLKLGIRAQNLPSEEEKSVLIQHIVEKYGNHTHEEIKLAFDLAITGNLVIEEREVSAYENFSCVYFSKIMTAYRVWAAKTYKAVVKEKVPEPVAEKLTDVMYLDWWKSASKDVRSGKITYAHVAAQLYDWAINHNDARLPQDIETSVYIPRYVKLHIAELVEDVKNKPEMRGQLEDFTRMKNQKRVEALYSEFVIRQCKRMAVYDVMKTETDEVNGDMVGSEPQATV